MPFDYAKVKDILVCPKTKADLVLEDQALVCTNPEARLSYPIVDDIPRLLLDEASELSVEQWGDVMSKHGRSRTTGEPA